jgi:hypothetical protein
MKNLKEIKQESISSSALKEAAKSLRHLVHYKNKPKETKGHFDFGNACELYFIDQDAFYRDVAVFDDSEVCNELISTSSKSPRATNVYKDWKAKFDKENEGKYIIPFDGVDSFDVIVKCYELFKQHEFAQAVCSGNYQDPFEWTDEKTGLKRYARTDIFNEPLNFITDLKTDHSGDFEKACNNMDYFLQAFDQIEGAVQSGKMMQVEHYYWLVITKTPPYAVDVYELDLDSLLKVEEKYRSTLHTIANTDFCPVWIKGEYNIIKPANWYK